MRFILFNAVVAAALIYLFSGGDQPGEAARRSVDEAMARFAELGVAAADRVEERMQVKESDVADAPGTPETPTEAPADPVRQSPPTAPAPAPVSAPEPGPQTEPAQPQAPISKPATQVATVPEAGAPVQAAPEPLPEREVATVPTHRVPKPGDPGPVAAPPAKAPIEIAEPMMSSQDRRKELFSLAQEMELMFATRVHE